MVLHGKRVEMRPLFWPLGAGPSGADPTPLLEGRIPPGRGRASWSRHEPGRVGLGGNPRREPIPHGATLRRAPIQSVGIRPFLRPFGAGPTPCQKGRILPRRGRALGSRRRPRRRTGRAGPVVRPEPRRRGLSARTRAPEPFPPLGRHLRRGRRRGRGLGLLAWRSFLREEVHFRDPIKVGNPVLRPCCRGRRDRREWIRRSLP